MAFYISKVDDNGNEIEIRHSARSLTSSINSKINRINVSARSCDTGPSVRYINSAAYIEKNFALIDITSRENSKSLDMSETKSDIVPPLDLQSEDNYPATPRDRTFSYRQHYAKIEHKPDKAYETWLSAKRKILSDEAALRKKVEAQKTLEKEERKLLSEEKYEKWIENKLRQQRKQSSQSCLSQQSTISSNSSIKTINSAEVAEKLPTRSHISDEQAQARIKEWERTKRLKEERQRLLKRQEEQLRLQLEEQRRQMAAEAWKEWLANAAKKPKPVPLNRGIFTLRGTISDIFVNPNEWQTTIAAKEEN